jgi:hypothetical protein
VDQAIFLLHNPPLSDLVGGINIVTLSDDVTKQRGLTSKTVQERRNEPTFDVVVEIVGYDEVAIHPKVKGAVDAFLSGGICTPEKRAIVEGEVKILNTAKIIFPIREEIKPKISLDSRERLGRNKRRG